MVPEFVHNAVAHGAEEGLGKNLHPQPPLQHDPVEVAGHVRSKGLVRDCMEVAASALLLEELEVRPLVQGDVRVGKEGGGSGFVKCGAEGLLPGGFSSDSWELRSLRDSSVEAGFGLSYGRVGYSSLPNNVGGSALGANCSEPPLKQSKLQYRVDARCGALIHQTSWPKWLAAIGRRLGEGQRTVRSNAGLWSRTFPTLPRGLRKGPPELKRPTSQRKRTSGGGTRQFEDRADCQLRQGSAAPCLPSLLRDPCSTQLCQWERPVA